MTKDNQVKKGEIVKVIIEGGRENEVPIYRHFYTGKIVFIQERLLGSRMSEELFLRKNFRIGQTYSD